MLCEKNKKKKIKKKKGRKSAFYYINIRLAELTNQKQPLFIKDWIDLENS